MGSATLLVQTRVVRSGFDSSFQASRTENRWSGLRGGGSSFDAAFRSHIMAGDRIWRNGGWWERNGIRGCRCYDGRF